MLPPLSPGMLCCAMLAFVTSCCRVMAWVLTARCACALPHTMQAGLGSGAAMRDTSRLLPDTCTEADRHAACRGSSLHTCSDRAAAAIGSNGCGPITHPPTATASPATAHPPTCWCRKEVWQAAGAPASSLSASATISPDTMALVVAMAWMMLPAMPCGSSGGGGGRREERRGRGGHRGSRLVATANHVVERGASLPAWLPSPPQHHIPMRPVLPWLALVSNRLCMGMP